MNKKLVYLFAVLVVGLFVISACQQDAVGRRNTADVVDYGIKITTSGDYVHLDTDINERDNIYQRIFYYNHDRGRIEMGSDNDEPLIIEEGYRLSAEDMDEEELVGMVGAKFIYDIDGVSHIVQIRRIDVARNLVSFRSLDLRREYENLPYNEGENTNFDFFGAPFTLLFEEATDSIIFTHINNNNGGRSKIRMKNPRIAIMLSQNGIDISKYKYNGAGEGVRGYGVTINLVYDEDNQEINIGEINSRGVNPRIRLEQPPLGSAGSDEVKINY